MKKYNPPPRRNFHIGEEGSINFDIGRKFPYGILFTSLSLPRFSYFFSFFTPRFSAPLVFYRACHAHEARTTLQKRFLKQIYCPRARWVRAANTRRTERNQPPSTLSLLPLEPNFSVQPRPLFHRQGVVSTFTSRCIFKPVSSGNISRPCHRWRPCVIRGERG